MTSIHPKFSEVKQSATDVIGTQAFKLKSQGVSLVDFGIGEPYFNTPEHVKNAGIKAIESNITKYTPVAGLPVLKQAILKKFESDNQLSYDENEIIVGVGAKQIIFNAFLASLEENDEVIIPAPHWVSYPDMVRLAGGTPVILPTSFASGYSIDPARLKELMKPNVKWIILNSPSNPTGKVYTRNELMVIADVLRKFPDTFILSDDIYEHIVFDDKPYYTLAQVAPDLKPRTLVVNGFSKGYNMTGWRIGYAAGPKHLVKALVTLASQSTTNTCSISQMAALAALEGPQDLHKRQSSFYANLRTAFCNALDGIPELKYVKSQGAFYMYINCSELIGRRTPKNRILTDDIVIAEALLDEARVVVIPGTAFGKSPCFRVSLGVDEPTLLEGCKRIKDFCSSLM